MRISIVIYFNSVLLLPRTSGFTVVPRLGLCVRHDHGHPEAHAQCIVHGLTLHPRRMPHASLVVGLQPHSTPFRRRLIPHGGLPCMATSEGSDQNERDRSQAEGASKDKGIYGLDPEIIEREAAEAPFRRFRLIAYGTLAFAAVLLGCVSIAGLSGVESVRELGQNLPNPILDVAVLGVAFYLWIEEVKTKRSTLRLMEKQLEQETRVPNRATRRQMKKNKSKEAQTEKAPAPRQRPSSARSGETRDDVSSELKMPSTVSNSDSGMFGGMMKTLEAVNQQSYYQALALNKELEDKGVLPRLDRKPDPPEDEAVAAGADLSRDSYGSLTTTEDSSSVEGGRGEMDVTNEGGGNANTDAGQEKNRRGKIKIVGKNQKK